MKFKLIYILFLVFQSIDLYSQKNEIDSDFFLLGTLSDYFGRQISNCDNNYERVDKYYLFESSLLEYNYNLFKNQYSDLTIDTKNTSLYSKTFAEKINKLYKFKFGESFCSDRELENGDPIDSVFIGKLKEENFKTNRQNTSYLIGVYTRYGELVDNKYRIRLANSYGVFQLCKKILKQVGCKKIKAKIYKNVPTTYVIYFEPTDELMNFFKDYDFLKEQIQKDYLKMVNEMNKK